jgi:hypothetical protein
MPVPEIWIAGELKTPRCTTTSEESAVLLIMLSHSA